LRYEVLTDWAKFPEELSVGDVAAVAVDHSDRVYLFTRGEHPMIVLDCDGNVLRTWGHGLFKHPHGLHVGPDETLYCTDDSDHTVRRCTAEGRLLLQLGVPGAPAPFMSGLPFHACTHTALSPQGEIYVSDGYGNACIHKFASDGRLLKTWGHPGCGVGEFYLPHNILCDAEGWVYVADRENHRVQIFDGEGRYETQGNNLHRPCALCMTGGSSPRFYIGELGPVSSDFSNFQNLGPRLAVLDADGKRLANLTAGPAGIGPGRFIAPHGIAVDSLGDVYVSEVANAVWPLFFPDTAAPARLPTIHKLRKVN
jgi:DNA-binding beta-propeller fold protein YncE